MNNCEVEQTARNVLVVSINNIGKGKKQWVLLTSDRHHDSPYCDREHEKRDLDVALERDALIIDVGDMFCAMQGKYDPRKQLGDVREEDNAKNYLDLIVEHAAEFYKPYANNFLLIGRGNHESSVLSRCGTDLISNLVYRLNTFGGNVFNGFFGGWIRFLFHDNSIVRDSKNLKYFHGAGGGGPVTRGVIQTNRQSVYLPDADIVVNGHTHDAWHVPIARERLSNKGTLGSDVIHHIRTPAYKRDYRDGAEGWHVERWGPPKLTGCVWLCFKCINRKIEIEVSVDVE